MTVLQGQHGYGIATGTDVPSQGQNNCHCERVKRAKQSRFQVIPDGIAVARNLPSAEMLAGRNTAVLFFDENSPGDAVVVAVYA